MTRQEIFTLIDRERAYQTQRWGTGFDRLNTPNDWVTYIAKYLGSAVTLPWNRNTFSNQLLKVAALAVAALEQPDYAPRHYDEPNATCLETKTGRIA